jgi:hypothetical protein
MLDQSREEIPCLVHFIFIINNESGTVGYHNIFLMPFFEFALRKMPKDVPYNFRHGSSIFLFCVTNNVCLKYRYTFFLSWVLKQKKRYFFVFSFLHGNI